MSKKKDNLTNNLRDTGKITIEAIRGITDIVEALHYKILRILGLTKKSKQGKTDGITGMVYDNIRLITQLSGSGIDVLLDKFKSPLAKEESSFGKEAVIAALNGVLGDYLWAKKNSLAIPMQFRRMGMPLDILATQKAFEKSGRKLLLLVHGLCMNDLEWKRQNHDHGESLASDLGFFPVYLHYNSGLHVSENGLEFSEIIEKLINQLPAGTEIYFLAHSMGGLLCRSALWNAQKTGKKWPLQSQKMIFLGTPHHGSPLEKAGNWIDNILEATPYSAPFARLGKIRSSGITDLRFGNLLAADWQGRDRFEFSEDLRFPVPLPTDIQCYTVAATIGKTENKLKDELIGDGLVPLASALGKHQQAKYNLQFPESHQYICRNTKHLDLLNSLQVYSWIKKWLLEK